MAHASCCARPRAKCRRGRTVTCAGSGRVRNGLRRWSCVSTPHRLRSRRSMGRLTILASSTPGPGSTKTQERCARGCSCSTRASQRTRRPVPPRCAWARTSDASSRFIRARVRCCSQDRDPTERSRWEGMSATAAGTTTAAELDVRPLATSDPTAAALLNAYTREIEERFVSRPACRVDTVADDYVEPSGIFLVVYDEGRPIACGGIRALPDGSGELKRMYVVPEARGRG